MTTESFALAAAQLAHLASRLLGWQPAEFWGSTPAELALAIVPPGVGECGPDRPLVEALMERFPDEERQTRNG